MLKKSQSTNYKCNGFGIGLRPCHFDQLSLPPSELEHRPDWLEIITENYLTWDQCQKPRSLKNLLAIRKNYAMAMHGVSLSLGSTDPLSHNYLKSLKELIQKVQPMWISDHLSWSSHGGQHLHDLLPLPYTEETIRHVVSRISQVQDFLGSRMLLENLSSYVEFEVSEMTEWEFLSEIARRADCGILLDVNNVYVSSRNHRFDPITYLENIPLERVGQIHLAGHSVVGKYLVDTHDAPVCPEVWELYRWTVENLGVVTTMIERDKSIPELQVLLDELNQARKISESARPQNQVYERTIENPITL